MIFRYSYVIRLCIFTAFINSCSNTESPCPAVCECRDHIVKCNKQQLLQVPLDIPETTQVLDLSDNELEELALIAFQRLPNLTALCLSSNNLSSIPEEFFQSVPNLKQLELRDNRLTSIPFGLGQLSALEKLDLRINRICNVSEDNIREIAHVHTIDLGKNRIGHWPKTEYTHLLNNITTLDLGGNELKVLEPSNFRGLKKLVNLCLARNKLEVVERNAFGDLLSVLDVSRNKIKRITSLNFASLSNLQTLILSKNLVDTIDPGAFHGVYNLQILNLSSNRLAHVSDGLFGLSNLTKLDLSSNQFWAVTEKMWIYVENLKWLSLAKNEIVDLKPYAFRPLSRLVYLSLAKNKLKNVNKKSFLDLRALEELNVSSNDLAVCVEEGSILQNTTLRSLKKLDFSSNLINTLPSRAFSGFPHLESLILMDNPIATINENAFEPLLLKELKMSTSLLVCDCRSQWFQKWLSSSGLDSADVDIVCDYPTAMRGLDFKQIELEKLTCLNQSPQAKVTMEPLPLILAQNGRDVRLFCKGYGAAPIHINWKIFENERERVLEEDTTLFIFQNHTADYETSGNEYVYSELILKNISIMDEAEYQCVVKNRLGSSYSSHSILRVHEIPRFVVTPSKEIAVMSGSTVSFPCKAVGIPEPALGFHKDGISVFDAVREKRVFVPNTGDILYLLRVNKKDEGYYSCIASNEAGQDTVTSKLLVFEGGFSQTMSDASVPLGNPLILFCRGTLSAPFNIQWLVNDTVIRTQNDLGITFKGSRNEMLVAQAVSDFNAGRYRCQIIVTEKDIILLEQSANVFIDHVSTNNDNAMRVEVQTTARFLPILPEVFQVKTTQLMLTSEYSTIPTTTPLSTSTAAVTTTTTTTESVTPLSVPTTTTKVTLSTSTELATTTTTTTATTAAPERIKPVLIPKGEDKKKSESKALFAAFYKRFITIYKGLDIQYIILLLILIALACTVVSTTCFCIIYKMICKRKPKKAKIRRDNYHSNSFKLEMSTSNNQNAITLNTYRPLVPSSTNSTCTYAS